MKSENRLLFRAIATVVLDNRRILGIVGELRDYYVHRATFPPNCPPLSCVLKCEESKAHAMLENVVSCIKRYPRGTVPFRAVEYWLHGSSIRLLDSLRETALLLPSELKDESRALIEAISAARNKEFGLCNFILGRSGAGERLTEEAYLERLDKGLRDLKACFNAIAGGFDFVEIALNRLLTRQGCVHKKRSPRTGEDSARDRIREMDLANIVKEVVRRRKAKESRGISTNVKRELVLLYKDEAWSRRCHQWKFKTLYEYIVRRRAVGAGCDSGTR